MQFANGHNGQFPADLSELKPYFKPPVDDAILQRLEILPSSKLSRDQFREFEEVEDWYVTQKAPVRHYHCRTR